MCPILVIYEDKDCVVVNKPAGLLMHDVQGKEKERTLVDWLLEQYPEVHTVGDDTETRPGIVHRLDKDTSGVLVIPRTQEYFEYLKDLFKTHGMQKAYYAIVAGVPKKEQGTIDRPIGLKPNTVKRTVHVRHAKMVKSAITDYVLESELILENKDGSPKRCALLRVLPRTGRTHQIRVHLASIGHPILGDPLYGGTNTKAKGVRRQCLHAYSMTFPGKEGKMLTFTADMPEDMKSLLADGSSLS